MEKLSISKYIVIIWILFVHGTSVSSCPTGCSCRGRAAKCGGGFSSFVTGLDPVTTHLGISGSPSQHNNIFSIRKTDFQGLSGLFSLTITFSGVRNIEDEAFSSLSNLGVLNLAENDIKTLTADTFKGLSHLNSLDLSGNNCSFERAMFTHINHLEYVNLGNMNITTLPRDLFDLVPNLKKILLYSNSLKEISGLVFGKLSNLNYLDVSTNKISRVSKNIKPIFVRLAHLNLADNPWRCDCQLLWLRELPKHFIVSVTDGKNLICHSPVELKYRPFHTIADTEMCGPPRITSCADTNYSLEVGSMLSMSCLFDGDPSPEIKWTRPDGFKIDGRGAVSGDYEIFVNGTLLISSVTKTDHGNWKVSAYNNNEQADKIITVNVMPPATPETTHFSGSLSTSQSHTTDRVRASTTSNTTRTSSSIHTNQQSKSVTKLPVITYRATRSPNLKSSSGSMEGSSIIIVAAFSCLLKQVCKLHR